MKLIKFENGEVTISDEALLVRQFRTLFNADKTKAKEKFMQQMEIVFFLADPRSNYSYIIDEHDRLVEICRQSGLPEDYKMTPELQDAIDIYKRLTITSSSLILNDMRESLHTMRQMMKIDNVEELDLEQRLKASNMIASISSKLPQLSKDLKETEKIVEKELEEAGRARGGNDSKKMYEDGF